MTWSQTHRRLDALRAIESELDRTGDGRLPWNPEYAAIFGDPYRLLLELRYRWHLLVEAQVEEPFDEAGRPSAALRVLAGQHRGLLAALRRHHWGVPGSLQQEFPEQRRPEHAGVAR
ncbi:hypothetical protein [Amycolatopsis anabasis]|uniref:hypothetical protein n=1 Tax=Amycolatopsis anabasis TaxID=1840409 RepID=UPI00131B2694|nr:hypothetical protein [Amycolatopsis anabasis]